MVALIGRGAELRCKDDEEGTPYVLLSSLPVALSWFVRRCQVRFNARVCSMHAAAMHGHHSVVSKLIKAAGEDLPAMLADVDSVGTLTPADGATTAVLEIGWKQMF